jgi:hypothetical protein
MFLQVQAGGDHSAHCPPLAPRLSRRAQTHGCYQCACALASGNWLPHREHRTCMVHGVSSASNLMARPVVLASCACQPGDPSSWLAPHSARGCLQMAVCCLLIQYCADCPSSLSRHSLPLPCSQSSHAMMAPAGTGELGGGGLLHLLPVPSRAVQTI